MIAQSFFSHATISNIIHSMYAMSLSSNITHVKIRNHLHILTDFTHLHHESQLLRLVLRLQQCSLIAGLGCLFSAVSPCGRD